MLENLLQKQGVKCRSDGYPQNTPGQEPAAENPQSAENLEFQKSPNTKNQSHKKSFLGPCPNCNFELYWIAHDKNPRCYGCNPPPAKSMVREFVLVKLTADDDFINERYSPDLKPIRKKLTSETNQPLDQHQNQPGNQPPKQHQTQQPNYEQWTDPDGNRVIWLSGRPGFNAGPREDQTLDEWWEAAGSDPEAFDWGLWEESRQKRSNAARQRPTQTGSV